MDDDYLDLYLDYSEMLQEARDEIAELRELVRDLVRQPATLCFGCKYEKHHDCESGFKCMLVERAKRLGIEVEA